MTLPTLPTVGGAGPRDAKIAVVYEAATADDLWKATPLAGSTGDFFSKLLNEAGILRSECFIIPVLRHRPPGDNVDQLYTQTKSAASKHHLSEVLYDTWVSGQLIQAIPALHETLRQISPKVVIALGDLSMFALTGQYGSVDTWRGSIMDPIDPLASYKIVPTYPPQMLYKQWSVKGFCVRDLQRVADIAQHPEYYPYPTYDFQIRPAYQRVIDTLSSLLSHVAQGQELWISCDIETIARHISCIGIAWSAREALCIPYMTLDGHYWSEEEEIRISFLLRELLTHPLCLVIGQNFNYDNQYFARYHGYLPNQQFDTMIAQHVLFPGIPKSLDFLSSMYCHFHRYWKDEINDYSRLPENMEQYWTYNCKDVCVTYEVAFVLMELLEHVQRRPQYDFMQDVARSALQSMLRGIRVDQTARGEVAGKLLEAISEYEALIQYLVGFPLNVNSPKQMSEYFYGDLGLPVQIDRKTKRPTLNAKAFAVLKQKEPLIAPLLDLIEKKRSLGVFLSTFCLMPLDTDKRMRCSFNVCGTETMRFSSSENAFGTGGNLQNIPKGEEK